MTALRIALIPVLWLLGATGTAVKLSKRKFGACLPPVMLISTLIMYFGQFIVGSFTPGLILLAVSSVAFIPLFAVEKDKEALTKRLFSTGFYVFIAAAFIFVIADFARPYYLWDELSHWGEMTKEMFRLDKFYNAEGTRLLVHTDYPPFISVFELLFCRLAGRYSEMGCSMAVHLLEMGMLIPAAEFAGERIGCSIKNGIGSRIKAFIYGWLFIASAVLLMVFMDADGTFSTIYKDIPVAMLFVYAMFLVMTGDILRKKTEAGFFIVSLCSILLSKQMGIAYIMVILFYLVLTVLTEENNKRTWVLILLSAVIPFVCNKTWKIQMRRAGVKGGQFDLGNISVKEYLRIITGAEGGLKGESFLKFLKSLFTKEITLGTVKPSYIGVFVLLMLLLVLGECVFRISKVRTVCFAAALSACTVGWAFTMSILYLFSFSDSEMVNLASYGRYMGSLMMAQFLLCVFFLCFNIRKDGIGLKEMTIYFLACAVLMTPAGLYHMLPPVMRSEESTVSYENMAHRIENDVPEGATVLIAAMDNIKTQYYVNYYSDNINVDLFYSDMENGDYSDPEFLSKVTDRIGRNDYLYVNEASEELINGLKLYVVTGDIEPDTIYQVINEDGELRLERVSGE